MSSDLLLPERYILTREDLHVQLLIAHFSARKNKSTKPYVAEFEANLEANLDELCDDLYYRRYKPLPSTRFLVTFPKPREIYAANYRDRIVHHLIYNMTHSLFERTFIYDTYSCIEGRGTHFGIERFAHQIRQCTHNYQREAYILSMDIKGYFIHIDRELLYEITRDSLLKMSEHYAGHGIRYCQILDFDFLLYILYEVIMLDPTIDCLTVGKESEYSVLPESKILKRGSRKGLPIGNLTSQLLSNVFLNILDQYIKRVLLFIYYGRYVDDFHLIDPSRERLRKAVPLITDFLHDELHLDINQGKTHIVSARQGAEFLGAFVKPYRIYISSQSLRRVYYRMDMELPYMSDEERFASINSTLGVLSHYDSYNIRKSLTQRYHPLYCGFAHCNADRTKLIMNDV